MDVAALTSYVTRREELLSWESRLVVPAGICEGDQCVDVGTTFRSALGQKEVVHALQDAAKDDRWTLETRNSRSLSTKKGIFDAKVSLYCSAGIRTRGDPDRRAEAEVDYVEEFHER